MKNNNKKAIAVLAVALLLVPVCYYVTHADKNVKNPGYETYEGVFAGAYNGPNETRLWTFEDGTQFNFTFDEDTPYWQENFVEDEYDIGMGTHLKLWYSGNLLYDVDIIEG